MSSPNPYQTPWDQTESYQSEPEHEGLGWILFSFEGRIPRRVFWGASLGIGVVFYIILFAVMLIMNEAAATVVLLLLYIPMVWISLAIQIKRWHDRDKSGWWIFIGFIPIIGAIWAFVETGCLRGTFGPNRFGADPT
ncbi:MAG: DUF805 domain-containing protein [Pirellulales bacterium]|nr:DUF805 domain-containing protein [Pirellulales bacterium]